MTASGEHSRVFDQGIPRSSELDLKMSPVSDINAMLRDIRAGGRQWRNQLPPGHLPSAPMMPGHRDIMEAEKQ
jgi:hypothetical protein